MVDRNYYEYVHDWQVVRAQASAVVAKGPGIYRRGVIVAGADAATITVYDGVDTQGKVIDIVSAAATTTRKNDWTPGQQFEVGLYVALTGTAPNSFVQFSLVPQGHKEP